MQRLENSKIEFSMKKTGFYQQLSVKGLTSSNIVYYVLWVFKESE